MKKLPVALAALVFILGAQAAVAREAGRAEPASGLSVTFLAPQDYADASYSRPFAGERDRAQVMRDIERHLRQLAERGLAPGCTLRVEVLDIDLAGHFEPWHFRDRDMRVMRDVTWPRMRLRYELAQGQQVLASAEERVADMNYLSVHNRYAQGDRLRYEKAMLDRWFAQRIAGLVSQ